MKWWGICAGLALGVLVGWGMNKFVSREMLYTLAINSDFRAYYLAGKMLYEEGNSRLYDLNYQFDVQSRFIPELNNINLMTPFVNPPWSAWLWWGFARMDFTGGYVWGVVVGVVIATWWVVWCMGEFGENYEGERFFWLFALLPFFPFVENVVIVQMALGVGCILFLAKKLIQSNKQMIGGIVLSLMSFKPHYALVVGVYLLITKRFKAAKGMFLGGMVLLMISYGLVGWKGIIDYVKLAKDLVGWDMAYGMRQSVEVSWRGLVKNEVVWWVAQGLSWWTLIRTWIKTHDEELRWTALMIGMLLVGIHANAYDLTILSLPAVWWIKKGWGVKALILGYLGTGLTTILVDNFKFIQIGPLVLFFLLVYLLMNVERFNDKEKSYLLQKSLGK